MPGFHLCVNQVHRVAQAGSPSPCPFGTDLRRKAKTVAAKSFKSFKSSKSSKSAMCGTAVGTCRPAWARQTLVSLRATPSSAPQGGDDYGTASSSSSGSSKSLKQQAIDSNQEVYDKLIDVFQNKKSSPEDWKKLIVYSAQWPSLAPGVFARLEELAGLRDAADDPEGSLSLRRFGRRLKGVSDGMEGHRALLDAFRERSSGEWEGLVGRRRGDMGAGFFEYIELRIRACMVAEKQREEAGAGEEAGVEAGGEPKRSLESESLAALGTQLSVLVEAYDRVAEDTQALDVATQNFADLLQSETMDAAEAKLDALASSGRLDPALLLTMAKAYSGVKDTDITKEEVKDIMAHLYFKAKEKFASQAPAEARILKFLLGVEEGAWRELLEQAFHSRGEESTNVAGGGGEDYLSTTPDALLNTIENILMVYDAAGGVAAEEVSPGGPSSMAGQAAGLMNPEVIDRMRRLRDLVRKHWM